MMSVYLGPFMKCVLRYEQESIGYMTCMNSACSNYKQKHMANAFCSKCGIKLSLNEEIVSTLKSKDHYGLLEVAGRYGDMFFVRRLNDRNIILAPNIHYSDSRQFYFENYDGFYKILDVNSIREIETMRNYFADPISLLEKNYEKIEFCWGLVF